MSAGRAVHVDDERTRILGDDRQQRYQQPRRTRTYTMACAKTRENGYGPCARDRVIGRKPTTHHWRLLQSDAPKAGGTMQINPNRRDGEGVNPWIRIRDEGLTGINPNRDDGEGVNPWIRNHDKGLTEDKRATAFYTICHDESSNIRDDTNGFAELADLTSLAKRREFPHTGHADRTEDMSVIGPFLAGRFVNVIVCGEEHWAVSAKGVTQSRLLKAMVTDVSEYRSLWMARHANDGVMVHFNVIAKHWASELVFIT